MVVDFQESTSAIIPLCCTHAHSYSATTHLLHSTSLLHFILFSLCVCLWHCGMQRLRASDVCLGILSTQWDTKREKYREKELLQVQRLVAFAFMMQ